MQIKEQIIKKFVSFIKFSMKQLSVCMIVKNEEKVLGRCLDCVCQFADEIVIVDTGSLDKTIKIAKKYTDLVFSEEWTDDFSKARNFSFSKATCEYVMWLDADDVVTPSEINKINTLKKNMCADVYMFKYAIAFDKNNNQTFTYYRERILKRSKNFVWEGFIHEAIAPRGHIIYSDITIEHRKIETKNPKRNMQIYNKKIKEGTILNPREQFYFARELFFNKKYKKCIKILKNYLKHKNLFRPNKLDAHKTIAECYLLLGENKEALKFLTKCLTLFQPTAEVCCLIGEIKVRENLQEAEFWFQCALLCKKNFESGAFIQHDFYDFIPYMQLCYINFNLKNFEKAKFYHEKAKLIHPLNSLVLYNDKFFSKS